MYNLISESAKIGNNSNIEYGAVISDNVVLGQDCFIGYHTIIRPNVIIGDHTQIRSLCFIAEEAKIGSNVLIYQFTNICKHTVVEDKVFIGINTIFTNTKKISKFRNYNDIAEAPHVEYGARIGARCLILPGVKIACNSMIQAGSIVTKSTDPYCIYRGSPAIKIGEVPDDERVY